MTKEDAKELWKWIVKYSDAAVKLAGYGNTDKTWSYYNDELLFTKCNYLLELVSCFYRRTGWIPVNDGTKDMTEWELEDCNGDYIKNANKFLGLEPHRIR